MLPLEPDPRLRSGRTEKEEAIALQILTNCYVAWTR